MHESNADVAAPASADRRRSPLRVLFVSARYPPYTGGTEIHMFEIGRRLQHLGVDVSVLTTDPHGSLPREEHLAGIHVQRVRAWPASGDAYFAPGLASCIARGHWDIIHLHGYHTMVAPIVMLAALKRGIPYVVTFHSGGHSSRIRKLLRHIQWRALRPLFLRAAGLIAVSQFEATLFQSRLKVKASRIAIIPSGSELPAGDTEQKPAEFGPLIVTVGRIERYKGHHRVLGALPQVIAHYPHARLRIVGSGSYEPELRALVAKLGIADRVSIGAVVATDRQGMASVLQSADLFILLSEYESQAIAVIEALKLQRPVIVADSSALGYLARQASVRAVSLDSSPAEIAEAIIEELTHVRASSDLELPTWEVCAHTILGLYTAIIPELSCVS